MLESFFNDTTRPQAEEIFRGIENIEFQGLVKSGVKQSFKKGEIIFKEGGIPAGLYYIRSGHAKKFKITPLGDEQVFYICAPGELLGYHSLLADEWYYDSAAAIDECEIAFIPKYAFQKLLQDSPDVPMRLLKVLAHEFRLFKISIATLATASVKERLAINLLILDEKFKKGMQSNGSEIVLSRSDLASMVGTAKENLVRILADFKANKLIKIGDHFIQITDREGLIRIANLIGKP